jgi:choline dehydrogenase-like flavoprotein
VKDWSVLLLEAGGEEPTSADVPAFDNILHGTAIDWNYSTQPGNVSCGGKPCTCPRGKVLGGSSTINGMIYIRGSAQDYDNWAKLGRCKEQDEMIFIRGSAQDCDNWAKLGRCKEQDKMIFIRGSAQDYDN